MSLSNSKLPRLLHYTPLRLIALEDNGTLDASSALVKALLINCAILPWGRAPNNDTGFGRVNLDNSQGYRKS
jgi:hypothetical protein